MVHTKHTDVVRTKLQRELGGAKPRWSVGAGPARASQHHPQPTLLIQLGDLRRFLVCCPAQDEDDDLCSLRLELLELEVFPIANLPLHGQYLFPHQGG